MKQTIGENHFKVEKILKSRIGRKGRIEYDRQVCKYCLPKLAKVVSKAVGFGLSLGIGSSGFGSVFSCYRAKTRP